MVEYDGFGPEKVIEVYNPKVGMRGILVVHNTALGPAKGGIRMTSTVSTAEVLKLAKVMTWKSSLANLPFGGGKGGIIANSRQITPKHKQDLVRSYALALKKLIPDEYIGAPDISMGKMEMETFVKAHGNPKCVTGKPEKLGGLPHELGSAGFGVYHSAEIAAKFAGYKCKDLTIAIEGFGMVGGTAAKYLADIGATIVGVSDIGGLIYNPKGLDIDKLLALRELKKSVTEYSDGKKMVHKDIIRLDVDMLIPAAVPDLILASDVDSVKAKIIVEGSNIPMTPQVEKLLYQRNIIVVPDFVANAGGVIASYAELKKFSAQKAFNMIKDTVTKNTKGVLQKSKTGKKYPRKVAKRIARDRVLKKCAFCSI